MRKVLSLALCLLLCFQLVSPAIAADETATVCTLSTDKLNPGEEVTVTVTLENCVAVKSMGLTPVYDKNVFELVSGKWTDKGAVLANFDMKSGNAAAAFASATDLNGEIFTFVLRLKDGASAEGAQVSATAIIKDGSNNSVDCTAKAAKFAAAPAPTDPPVLPTIPAPTEVPMRPTEPPVSGAATVYTAIMSGDTTPGSTFEVIVNVRDSAPAKSMGLTPVYDKDVFELVSGEWSDRGAVLANFDLKTGNAAAAFAEPTNVNGDIFSYTLKVKEDAPGGSYELSTTAVIKDENNANVATKSMPASIYVVNEDNPGGDNPVVPDGVATIFACVQYGDVKPGDVVELPFEMHGCVPAKSMGLSFEYNKDIFELVSGEWSAKEAAVLANFDIANGNAAIAFAEPTDINGPLFTLTLKVRADAPTGEGIATEVIANAVIKDANNADVESQSVPGTYYLMNPEAPAGPVVSVSADTFVAAPGDSITFTVKLAGCEPVKSMGLTPDYDKNVFELVSGEWLVANTVLANFDVKNGNAAAAFAEAADINGEIFTFTLKVKDGIDVTENMVGLMVGIKAVIKNANNADVASESFGWGMEIKPGECTHENLREVPSKSPDCVNSGNNLYYTCDCGIVFAADAVTQTTVEEQTLPALGHDWADATCDAPKTCKRCQLTEGEALGHSFTTYVSNNDATCDADGTETAKCDRCDATDTRTVEGSALGHDWADATCDAPKTCKRCQLTEGEALGHSFTTYVSNNDATCDADGTETAKCDRCDATDTRTVAGSALNHPETEIRNAVPATEEAEGYTGDTYCVLCGKELAKGEVIPKLDHVHDLAKTEAVEATCDKAGSIAYWTCSKCGKLYSDAEATQEITKDDIAIPALGHSFTGYVPNNDATCEADGTETAKCDRCDATDTRTVEGSALGHDWADATCDAPKTCKRCQLTEGEALNHPETEIRNAKEATAEAEGYTGDTHCVLCGKLLEEGKVIPKLEPAEAAVISCVLNTEELVPGTEVTVTYTLENCAPVKSMGLTPVYDKEIFELVSGEWLVKNAALANFDAKNGNAAAAFSDATDINGEIFVLVLRVKDDVTAAEAKIGATAVITDASNNKVANTSQDIDVTVGETEQVLWGDVNMDGEVDLSDAILVLKIAGEVPITGEYNLAVANVDGSVDEDGNPEIDLSDAILILKRSAEIIEVFPVEQQS